MKTRLASFLSDVSPWLILAAALFTIHATHPLDSDEGVILNGAWNLLNGRQLYIDFFEFVPPGAFLFLAAAWKLLGISYLNAKLVSLLLILVGALGLERLASCLKAGRWSLVAPVGFILSSIFWIPINHNAYALVPAIWSVYCFVRALNRSNNLNLFLCAGLVTGLTGLFLQHKGLAIGGAGFIFLLYLYIQRQASAGRALITFTLAALFPISIACLFWPPALLYENLIAFPFFRYHETNVVPLTFWYMAAAVSFLIFWAARAYLNRRVWYFFTCLQIILLVSALPRPDISHVAQAIWPIFILLAVMLQHIQIHRLLRRVLAGALILFSIGCIITFLPHPFLDQPNPIMRATAATCSSVYSGPFLPNLYFELRHLNPLPYSILITNQQTPEQFSEAAALLAANPPACVFLNYGLVDKFGYTKANPVDQLITERYYFAGSFGSIDWYRLK